MMIEPAIIMSMCALILFSSASFAQLPTITCPAPIELSLEDIGPLSIELPISHQDSVYASCGEWLNDTLHFEIAAPVTDTVMVIACNLVGEDTCEVVYSFPGVTTISGTVDGEVWSKSESPYCVVGDCRVGLLEMEPGVEVVFFGNYEMEVVGGIVAVGDVLDSISFQKYEGAVYWHRLYFNESGSDSEFRYCLFEGSNGRALYIYNANVTIGNCKFINNSGGGLYSNQPLDISYCDFLNNDITTSNNTYGGGLHAGAGADLVFCRFIDNDLHSSKNNENKASYGGGLYVSGDASISNCVLLDNSTYAYATGVSSPYGHRYAYSRGGAIFVSGNSRISNCIVKDNSSTVDCPGYHGHPIRGGSGIYVSQGDVVVTNCTVVGNNYEGLRRDGGSVEVLNSILWDNGSTEVYGTVDKNYCCIQDADTTGGNLDHLVVSNPAFYDEDSLTLLYGSPCIDAGHPDPLYNECNNPGNPGEVLWPARGSIRCDLGAYGGPGAIAWLGCPEIDGPSESTLSPQDGTIGSEDVTFIWGSVDYASGYEIRIDTAQPGDEYTWLNATLLDTTLSISIPTDQVYWQVKALGYGSCADGFWTSPAIYTDVAVIEADGGKMPSDIRLEQNYPNPFNPSTVINFVVPRRTEVSITIYNLLGETVAELGRKECSPGGHRVEWDGMSSSGQYVSTGVYFYRIEADGYSETKKMVLLR